MIAEADRYGKTDIKLQIFPFLHVQAISFAESSKLAGLLKGTVRPLFQTFLANLVVPIGTRFDILQN